MPKIPTFTIQARPTAEVAGVKSNLQIDPTKTPAAGLSALAGVAQDYYIKQRDNVEKLEANKKFYEMKTEGAKIANELKNNPNEFEVENIYNNRFSSYKNSVIQGIKNKRVRKKIENLISLDQPETIYKLKQNAFKQYEIQENEMYNTKQNTYANEYSLELDLAKKDQKKQQRLNTAKEYESKMLKGKEWLSKELKKIETDSVIFDADKAIASKNFILALNILKKSDKSKVDPEEVQKKLIKIQGQFTVEMGNKNLDNIFLSGQGSKVFGAGIKNIDNKEITKKDLEKTANRFVLQTNLDGSLKYTTAQVIEQANKNNTKVPLYLETLDAGGNITDTSNKNATLTGLQLYQTFKNQNALQSLTSIYQLGKDDLSTYQRLDFSMNTMKQTFEQAFNNELQFKNNPDKFKLLKADGKAVVAKVNELDFPGVTPFEFGLEFENQEYANIIMKNVANNVMIATGSQQTSLEFAKDYIEKNYRIDAFKQLVPINNAYPSYHDASVKLYIKDLYESGRINKEQYEEEDIIPFYFTVGSLTSNQGFILRDKKTGVPITIDVVDPQGDFDEGSYDKSRMTYKDIVEKIYPLMKDQRYKDFIITFNRIKEQKKEFDETINVMP